MNHARITQPCHVPLALHVEEVLTSVQPSPPLSQTSTPLSSFWTRDIVFRDFKTLSETLLKLGEGDLGKASFGHTRERYGDSATGCPVVWHTFLFPLLLFFRLVRSLVAKQAFSRRVYRDREAGHVPPRSLLRVLTLCLVYSQTLSPYTTTTTTTSSACVFRTSFQHSPPHACASLSSPTNISGCCGASQT